jgi:transposase
MSRSRPWIVDQPMLLPPSVNDFVKPRHLAVFVRDLVQRELDLAAVERAYSKDPRGNPPYHPGMMTALLLYAYCRGVYASRQIAIACEERVDFMALTGMQEPDFRTISDFRKLHRAALEDLFVQVLRLCREAGLAKLGHVALDGTKVHANASKHKAMSYARMKEAEPKLAAQVEEWMKASGAADKSDDKDLGAEVRGDEMPDWVVEKQARIAKLREAKRALESAAKAEAAELRAERVGEGKPVDGPRAPKALSGEVDPKAQRNFTDPDSKILRKGSEYVQGYNAQVAVDAAHQVIVAADVVSQQNDADQLVALLDQIEENTGARPAEVSADTGYCSEENLASLDERSIRGYIATGRQERGMSSPTNREKDRQGPRACAMRARLRRGGWNSRYRLRKVTVEPVFGQIKERRGFRRFSLRGREKVRCEWRLVCAAHNLVKLAAWSRRDLSTR